jgi:hypothetical protein
MVRDATTRAIEVAALTRLPAPIRRVAMTGLVACRP